MDRHLAIRNTHPTVVTINGENEAWNEDGNVVALNEVKIEAEMTRLQAEQDSNKYQRDRKEEYPSTPDQLDYIFHHGVERGYDYTSKK